MYEFQAEQRLAARRAARAEAREIRMRELERQQREQEDHADKAYDMYAGKTPGMALSSFFIGQKAYDATGPPDGKPLSHGYESDHSVK